MRLASVRLSEFELELIGEVVRHQIEEADTLFSVEDFRALENLRQRVRNELEALSNERDCGTDSIPI